MTADQWAIAGIVISLIIGVPAYFTAKSIKKNKQEQNIGRGGIGYQAGGDIRIKQPDE